MRPLWCWRKFSISLGKYARGNKRHQGLVRPSTLSFCPLFLGSNQPLTFLNSFYHFFLLAFIHSFLPSFFPSYIPFLVPTLLLSFIHSFISFFFHLLLHSFLLSFLLLFLPSFFPFFVNLSFIPSFLSSFLHSFLPYFYSFPSILSPFNHTFFSFLLPKYLSCHSLFFQRYEEVWDYNYCHGETNFNRPGHENKDIGHFTQVYTILILYSYSLKMIKLPNLV